MYNKTGKKSMQFVVISPVISCSAPFSFSLALPPQILYNLPGMQEMIPTAPHRQQPLQMNLQGSLKLEKRSTYSDSAAEKSPFGVKTLASDGMVLQTCVHDILAVQQIATIKDDWQAHQLFHSLKIGCGELSPLGGND